MDEEKTGQPSQDPSGSETPPSGEPFPEQGTHPARSASKGELEDRLENINRRILELAEGAGRLAGRTQKDWEGTMRELGHKAEATRTRLRQMEEAGGKAVGDIRQGLVTAFRDLETAYNKALSNFRSSREG